MNHQIFSCLSYFIRPHILLHHMVCGSKLTFDLHVYNLTLTATIGDIHSMHAQGINQCLCENCLSNHQAITACSLMLFYTMSFIHSLDLITDFFWQFYFLFCLFHIAARSACSFGLFWPSTCFARFVLTILVTLGLAWTMSRASYFFPVHHAYTQGLSWTRFCRFGVHYP